jgi:poly(hydroxyalkanoate) depolymerase family esterase
MWQKYSYSDSIGNHPYAVYTPEHYHVGTPVPLVVMLHGCAQTATDFAAGTQMNELAAQHNFIVVYPQQSSAYNQNLCWNWFLPENQVRGGKEPSSIVGIVQEIQHATTTWTIDPTRIYVTGLSAGGAMAVILGVTYPDVFAAIGVHSGVEYQAASSPNSAFKAMRKGGPDPLQQGQVAHMAMSNIARIVPTIVFHGTNDPIIASVNGDQTVQQWMHTNHLASPTKYTADFYSPTSVTSGHIPSGRSYITAMWSTPKGEEVQAYWKVEGMGHAWSGGNPKGSYTDKRGPDASLAMYAFFMAHPMKSMKSTDSDATLPRRKLHRILLDLFTSRGGKRNI